jgi:hypothetical protein
MAGIVSVSAYARQVWCHSWHGAFIQEVEYDSMGAPSSQNKQLWREKYEITGGTSRPRYA